MRKQIIKFLFLLLAFGYATEAKSGEFTVDDIWYYYTNEDDDEVGVMYSKSGEYSGDVVIPSTVTYNGKQYTVTSIGSKAFSGCTRLKKVTIPNSVTNIGDNAFSECRGLKAVTIGNSVTSIGSGAFTYCSYLTEVTIPNSVTNIGDKAFYYCYGLKAVTIGNSVTSIGDYAFDGCPNLIEITIPNSVTNIGDNAFSECRGLKAVTIGNSVTAIGGWAFSYCTGLTTVVWNARSSQIPLSEFGNPMPPFSNCDRLTDFVFGEEVEHIPAYLCYNLTSLKNLVIGNSVTTIGNSAFSDCTGLTTVTWNARNVQDFQSTGGRPFSNCKNLTEFVFGEEVEHIPDYLCYKLTTLKNLVIGNSVTSIGEWAFHRCTSLTEVTIPNSVTTIGGLAFYSCTGLQKVTIGNSVKSIGDKAFYFCTDLKTVTIGNSVKSIGDKAFYFCNGLTEVSIPNSVTSIGSGTFEDCTGLKTVTIGNSVKSIGNEAFPHCTSLTAITIPNSVTSIESGTFFSCTSLKTVTIGNSVKSIGSNAFSSCTSLTAITIPNSVTSIGDETFYNCRSLEHVTSKAMMPPQIWVTTFDDYAMTLYVPAGCKSKYAEAEYWNNFTDIRETGVVLYTVTANATDETMGYVTGGGEYPQGSTATLVAIPFGQNYFVRWNDGNTDNPRTITVTGDMTFTAEFAPAGSAVETLGNGERGIYATGRTLHVENGGESYRVYTAAGRLVYTGNDSSVTLSAPGMYIVRTGDRSQKVAVK